MISCLSNYARPPGPRKGRKTRSRQQGGHRGDQPPATCVILDLGGLGEVGRSETNSSGLCKYGTIFDTGFGGFVCRCGPGSTAIPCGCQTTRSTSHGAVQPAPRLQPVLSNTETEETRFPSQKLPSGAGQGGTAALESATSSAGFAVG